MVKFNFKTKTCKNDFSELTHYFGTKTFHLRN